MLQFGVYIDLGVIEKLYAVIFEILFFRNFSECQKFTFLPFQQNVGLWPPKNCEKSKFHKSLPNFFVSPQNLSPNQCSASTDFMFLDLSRFMSIYFMKGKCIWFQVNDHKMECNDIWIKYDPILKRRKIGLWHML